MAYLKIQFKYFLIIWITVFMGCSDAVDTTALSEKENGEDAAKYWSSTCDKLLLSNSQENYQICYGFVGSDETKKATLAGNYDFHRIEIRRYSAKHNSSVVIYRYDMEKDFIESISEKANLLSNLYELDNTNIYIYPNYPSLTTVISHENVIASPPFSIPYE